MRLGDTSSAGGGGDVGRETEPGDNGLVVGALGSGEDTLAGDVLAEAAAARKRSSNRDLAGFVVGGGLGVWIGLGER